MRNLANCHTLKTGQIRKVYDATTGKRIRCLPDLHAGHNIVLVSYDAFKRMSYVVQDLTGGVRPKRELTPGRIVAFYPNGDSYHSGYNVTIYRKRYPTLQKVPISLTQLLDHLNTQIEMVTGQIHKVYTLDGVRCNSIDSFEKGKGYVLVASDDPFIRTHYNIMKIPYHKSTGLNGSTLSNEFMANIRPVTVRRQKSVLQRKIHHDHERYDTDVSRFSLQSRRHVRKASFDSEHGSFLH